MIAELKNTFKMIEHLKFKKGNGNLPLLVVNNSFASCTISLYGAHVLSYQPKDEKDVLWMSSKSLFEEGKPIRGGVPICFPWFGPHAIDASLPVHGFARLNFWNLKDASITAENETKIALDFNETTKTLAIWPHAFNLELTILIGKKLEISLSIQNSGQETFFCSNALHTYFQVGNLPDATISGLKDSEYYDPASGLEVLRQEEELLRIMSEENRRYFAKTSNCILHDPNLKRNIEIGKTGSQVTVVWNPGSETAKKITDIVAEDYKSFVCIEAANTYQDTIQLKPNEQHVIGTLIRII